MKGYLYIFAAAALWGLLGPFAKLAFQEGIAPLEVAFWRAILAWLCFGSQALWQRQIRVAVSDLPVLGLFSLTGVFFFYGSYQLAVQKGGAALASVLLYTAPAWVALMAGFFFKEKMTRIKMAALAATLAGVALVSLGAGGAIGGASGQMTAAVMWGLVAGFCYSLYYIFGKYFGEKLSAVTQELTVSLQTFSPKVEPIDHTGAFHVDPEGLRRLYGGYRNWATCIHRYLRARHWRCSVTVGFHRYRALAVAMLDGGVTVLDSAKEERAMSDRAPLGEFDLPGAVCESLATLGVDTLGGFLRLPGGELHSRFGQCALALHDRFADSLQLPIQPHAFEEPARISFQIDPPDDDQHRLLFAIKGALHSLLHQVTARAEAIQSLELSFQLERASLHREHVEPASPTVDSMMLLELIRLRLGQVTFEVLSKKSTYSRKPSARTLNRRRYPDIELRVT